MIYTDLKDIYSKIKVGMKINFRKTSGIITKIIPCECEFTVPCRIKIGIDGENPTCYMCGSISSIVSIEDDPFISESEFSL